jgi:hypothetical protein
LSNFRTIYRETAIRLDLRQDVIGNSLTALRSEWIGKTPLNHALGYHRSYRGRFSVRLLEDNSGWVIVRLR